MGLTMRRKTVLYVLALSLAGCTPFIPVTELEDVPGDTMRDALNVKLVRTGDPAPKVKRVLGRVSGNSCKHWTWDPPPSNNDALLRMRVEAAQLKANAIVDVICNQAGTDTFGTNCWASVSCKGAAVVTE